MFFKSSIKRDLKVIDKPKKKYNTNVVISIANFITII